MNIFIKRRKHLVLHNPPETGPKILLFDIETSPMLGHVWSLWENNVALNQLHTDWHVLAWAAKWLGDTEDKVMYQDQRNAKDIEDDSHLLKNIWSLLDMCDIAVGQNSKKFDTKKLNARFILNGFQPPTKYRQIDTVEIAKRRFGFTSNKLEYMTDKLCTKYKKSKHKKFSGFELWKECLAGNMEAWEEMKEYNTFDVLSLEELYLILRPWADNHLNLSVYDEGVAVICSRCGGTSLHKRGFAYTSVGKYQKWRCLCGAETRDKINLLSKEKRATLHSNIL
jgi:hypothetical protein